MKKFNKAPLAVAMGSAMLSSFAFNVQADTNPFALNELAGGYMVADAKTSHAACGSNVSDSNGNPVSESKSASHKAHHAEKKAEGSCGEGMCGGMMSGGKMKPGMEQSCGAMMKGHEGSCGMMMGGMNHGDDKSAKAKGEEGSCGAMMGGKQGTEHSCGAMMKGNEASCGAKVDANKAAGH